MPAIAAVSAVVPLSVRTKPQGANCRASNASKALRPRRAAWSDTAARTPASHAGKDTGECTGTCRRHGTPAAYVRAPAARPAFATVVIDPDPPGAYATRARPRPPR